MKRFALLNANGVKPPLLLSYLSLYMPRKWASLVLYTDTLVGKKNNLLLEKPFATDYFSPVSRLI